MKLILGHSNADLDCIACMQLARRLYPDHLPVMSGSIHPRARNLYNLYEKELNFLPLAEIEGKRVESLVIVDTRSYGRVSEFLGRVAGEWREAVIRVIDHHSGEENEFQGANVRFRDYGAGASLLVELLREECVKLGDADATIALCGIYADTGNFTHPNVSAVDLSSAAYLVDSGASIHVATSLSKVIRDERQVELFHQAMASLRYRSVNGHRLAEFELELPRNTPGLAAIVERVFDSEEPDALFARFCFARDGSVLLVARSAQPEIRVSDVLSAFGGGGHPKASSALVKGVDWASLREELDETIKDKLRPALQAREIMSTPVQTLQVGSTLLEASLALEALNHTGAPVVDEKGTLVGFLTLRDIMKGRRKQMMHAPVKAFMTNKVIVARPEHTLRELASLFFKHNIGHLPVLDSGGLAGIVTRSDYLATLDGHA